MPIRFSYIILISTFLLGGLIYILHLSQLVTAANEIYVRFSAFGLFAISFVLLGLQKARHHQFSWDDFYKNNTFIIVSFTILLVSMLVRDRIGFYFTGIFAGAALLHFLYTRKFYKPPTSFYFIILYALLLFFGTIGTEKGFHFSSRILAFFVLPLSFCFFRLSKKTLLEIGEIFFKMTIVFLAICILYWWYNFLHLDVDFINWITDKNHYPAEMIGWKAQAKAIAGGIEGWENISFFSAYFFVTSWSYFYHPSFVSFVLFFGLITGFYLYHKKNTIATITKFELILSIILCFLVIGLMESRIGLVGLLFILAATGLYYLKLKTKYFKIGIIAYLLLGGASLFILSDSVSGFVNDKVRDSYNSIAVHYIQEHFWWGSGFLQEQKALEQQAEIMKDSLPQIIYPHIDHPIFYVHNQFLGNMVQFGIWGLIALVAMLCSIMYYAIKNRSYLLQMMVFVTVLFMLIEEPFYKISCTIVFVSFLVFFTAINESNAKNKSNII